MNVTHTNAQQGARPQIGPLPTTLTLGIEFPSVSALEMAILDGEVNVRLPVSLYDPETGETSTLRQSSSLGLLYREWDG